MTKRRQNFISAGILIGGTILSFLFFGPHKINSQDVPEADKRLVAARVKTVTLGSEQSKTAVLTKSATFQSAESATATAEYSGKISKIDFEIGDFVVENQTLAYFDQSSTENSPKVSLESALANRAIAHDNLEKTKNLAEENLEIAKNSRKIAEIQFDQAEDGDDKDAIKIAERNLENAKDLEDQMEESSDLQINGAEQQLNGATEAVSQAKIAVENTIIKAPISGVVVSRMIDENDFVGAGEQIAEIVAAGKIEATLSFSESQISRVSVGDEVEISIGNEIISGQIASLSPVANNSNQRFDVKISSDEEVSAGANTSGAVSFDLSLETGDQNTFFVPLEAVNIGQKKTVVFVVAHGKALSTEVKTGQVVGTQIELIQGVSVGDEVVAENSRNLQDGQLVEIQ